ncbi:MAG: methylmalonyl-CoA epimerase, partial [Candidatus Dormibacteraeota bacterium]|nr:methylmalonyl-CoA epimerase [Candidatus Dormibacteraeota bacterium]
MIKSISHLGLAVRDLDEAIQLYEQVFGVKVTHRWVAEQDRMEAAAFKIGEVEIELMQPLGEDSPVARFIDKHGEGMHHIAYKVADVDKALREARANGLETIDQGPRRGGDGKTKIGFLHPRSTHGVLTELAQD